MIGWFFERPLACVFGIHQKRQHPGIPFMWFCRRCEREGNW